MLKLAAIPILAFFMFFFLISSIAGTGQSPIDTTSANTGVGSAPDYENPVVRVTKDVEITPKDGSPPSRNPENSLPNEYLKDGITVKYTIIITPKMDMAANTVNWDDVAYGYLSDGEADLLYQSDKEPISNFKRGEELKFEFSIDVSGVMYKDSIISNEVTVYTPAIAEIDYPEDTVVFRREFEIGDYKGQRAGRGNGGGPGGRGTPWTGTLSDEVPDLSLLNNSRNLTSLGKAIALKAWALANCLIEGGLGNGFYPGAPGARWNNITVECLTDILGTSDDFTFEDWKVISTYNALDRFWCTVLPFLSYVDTGVYIDSNTFYAVAKETYFRETAGFAYFDTYDTNFDPLMAAPGDVIFYNSGSGANYGCAHVGIVFAVTEDYIVLVESNAHVKTVTIPTGSDGLIDPGNNPYGYTIHGFGRYLGTGPSPPD